MHISHTILPKPTCFTLPLPGMNALHNELRHRRQMVAAQIHTHPGRAYHSKADDRWAIVRHVGALSLVLPNFAFGTTTKTFFDNARVYRFSEDGLWSPVPQKKIEWIMPDHFLTPEARRENATALATALGLSVSDAAEALDLSIVITVEPMDETAVRIRYETSQLLNRTVREVSEVALHENIAAELIIGSAKPTTSARHLYLNVLPDRVIISQNKQAANICAPTLSILTLLISCYTSAATLYRALNRALPFAPPDPLVLEFCQLGIDWSSVAAPIDLERAYIAGAGAIGNGFLWAARHLNFRGHLTIADDDTVSPGNLNRQVWFQPDDIGLPKVTRIVERAQMHFPQLKLLPNRCRLQDLPDKSNAPWLRRLIVAVDSRRARREFQNEFSGEMFDASTTDIREIVVHYNIQPNVSACLSCIYEMDEEEITREKHIAEHLGVSVRDVRTDRISKAAAERIVMKYSELLPKNLIGVAYDTLFKTLCAEGQLQTPEGKRVVASFAFVSVLAGTLLALEVVRRLGPDSHSRDFNYWRLSPWHPVDHRRRITRQRQPGCAFCADPILRRVNLDLWG